MQNFKLLFKKNSFLTIILIVVILFSIFTINHLKKNTDHKISIGGSFELTDENGEKYSSKEIKKKKLVYFGYTFCPDICPFDILRLSNLLDRKPEITEKVDSLFITIDPERDSRERLNSFLKSFNPKIKGLYSNTKQIELIKKQFRVYVRLNKKNKNDKDYLVDHTILFFLLDKNDEYIHHFRSEELESQLINYIL